MAVRMETNGTTEKIRRQAGKERRLKFRIVNCVLIAAAAAFTLYSGWHVLQDFQTDEAKTQELSTVQAEYERVKKESEDRQAEAEQLQEQQQDVPVKVEDREMTSARAAGERAAELMMRFYADGGLVQADREEFASLVEGTSPSSIRNWYETGGNAKGPDYRDGSLSWEFRTFYDVEALSYNVCWMLWHQGANSRYLIEVLPGTYDGTTGKFRLGNPYYTSFADMLDTSGQVEANPGAAGIDPQLSQNIDALAQDMPGEEGEGSGGTANDDQLPDAAGSSSGSSASGSGSAAEQEGAGGGVIPDSGSSGGTETGTENGGSAPDGDITAGNGAGSTAGSGLDENGNNPDLAPNFA